MKAVSAEALLPVVSLLAQERSQAASDVEDALWNVLLDVDDLSVSTGASLDSYRGLTSEYGLLTACTHAKQ